jgi:transposase
VPVGHARWTGPLIAARLGDVDVQHVWRFLREQKIDLAARKSWCESNDPAFAAKAAEIVGLYLDPPSNALVLAVDEKPSIQALERKQGYLKLASGRALTGQSHDYKRHGTTTLFAAFDIATGKVSGRHYNRRRRVALLNVMNRLLAQHPGREIHVILDNLSTHKPKHDQWLKRHRNVHFHFTPTHASWLNQVEIWFSILTGKSLAGASFNSVAELKARIGAFIATYNDTAKPLAWRKSEAHQKRLKAHFADYCFWVLANDTRIVRSGVLSARQSALTAHGAGSGRRPALSEGQLRILPLRLARLPSACNSSSACSQHAISRLSGLPSRSQM